MRQYIHVLHKLDDKFLYPKNCPERWQPLIHLTVSVAEKAKQMCLYIHIASYFYLLYLSEK